MEKNKILKVAGTVDAMRKDKRAIKLDNDEWYSDFNELKCNWKDKVEVEYVLGGPNNEYKNIQSLKVIKNSDSDSIERNSFSKKEFDPTTMLVSYAKDLTKPNDKTLMENAIDILKCYNFVKEAVNNEVTMIKICEENE